MREHGGDHAVGALAHSLALLSNAAPMLTDIGAIVLSLIAMRLAARPPAGGLTFGLKTSPPMGIHGSSLEAVGYPL